VTWHRREWWFPRSHRWALVALLALPLLWLCDPWAREELVKRGFDE